MRSTGDTIVRDSETLLTGWTLRRRNCKQRLLCMADRCVQPHACACEATAGTQLMLSRAKPEANCAPSGREVVSSHCTVLVQVGTDGS